MSEAKPSSGDATLDALVRDLSAKVRATDGRWVEENAPKDGPKSIYDDFEGAVAAAIPAEVPGRRRRTTARAGRGTYVKIKSLGGVNMVKLNKL